MPSGTVPASLRWLLALVLLAVGAAALGGAILYHQAREATKVQADAITGGKAARAKVALARYGCAACHVIPGIAGANGQVGPDLTQVGQRATLAGQLANDPGTMVRWLMRPQQLVPGSGMPEQGLSEQEARDIAAYLYAES